MKTNSIVDVIKSRPVADAASLQRYSTEMMNIISAGLDKTATDAANAAQNRSAATMDVQSAADDTGLPMLVVRVCQRLAGSGR